MPPLSRYTGPRLKVQRALGTALPGLSRKSPDERNYPPGQHGAKQKRKSDYGLRPARRPPWWGLPSRA